MNTELSNELEELHEGLRAWARGLLPAQAAVEFLIGCKAVSVGNPMVAIDDEGECIWLNLDVDDDIWAERTGYMSGGERATWHLARSILCGELEEWFWRLDATRRAHLLRALLANQ
jgi:hypothetical protein